MILTIYCHGTGEWQTKAKILKKKNILCEFGNSHQEMAGSMPSFTQDELYSEHIIEKNTFTKNKVFKLSREKWDPKVDGAFTPSNGAMIINGVGTKQFYNDMQKNTARGYGLSGARGSQRGNAVLLQKIGIVDRKIGGKALKISSDGRYIGGTVIKDGNVKKAVTQAAASSGPLQGIFGGNYSGWSEKADGGASGYGLGHACATAVMKIKALELMGGGDATHLKN